jgi:hypothetical protein
MLANPNDWRTIITDLSAQIAEDDLPDKVSKFTEHLISGYSVNDAARRVRISQQTAQSWLAKYPKIAELASKGRELLSSWRMTRLEQQFLQAIDRSEEILAVNLDGTDKNGNKVDPKVLTVVAAQARYMIGLFASQQRDITVTHQMGDTVLKAREDALEYLASQLKDHVDGSIAEPVEVAYTVISPRVDNHGPLLREDGEPNFGQFGELDIAESGTLCHVCGRRTRNLVAHAKQAHTMSRRDYETLYMLEDGTLAGEQDADE